MLAVVLFLMVEIMNKKSVLVKALENVLGEAGLKKLCCWLSTVT